MHFYQERCGESIAPFPFLFVHCSNFIPPSPERTHLAIGSQEAMSYMKIGDNAYEHMQHQEIGDMQTTCCISSDLDWLPGGATGWDEASGTRYRQPGTCDARGIIGTETWRPWDLSLQAGSQVQLPTPNEAAYSTSAGSMGTQGGFGRVG